MLWTYGKRERGGPSESSTFLERYNWWELKRKDQSWVACAVGLQAVDQCPFAIMGSVRPQDFDFYHYNIFFCRFSLRMQKSLISCLNFLSFLSFFFFPFPLVSDKEMARAGRVMASWVNEFSLVYRNGISIFLMSTDSL